MMSKSYQILIIKEIFVIAVPNKKIALYDIKYVYQNFKIEIEKLIFVIPI